MTGSTGAPENRSYEQAVRVQALKKGAQMNDDTVTLTLSKADAEVLLGVLSSERYNAETEAVCNQIRKQLDERLAEIG
jgi:hypothetical protein